MAKSASYQKLCQGSDRHCGVLRVHPDNGHWQFRSDFSFVCTMLVIGEIVELWGAERLPTHSEARAICELMYFEGPFDVQFEHKGVMKIRRGKTK